MAVANAGDDFTSSRRRTVREDTHKRERSDFALIVAWLRKSSVLQSFKGIGRGAMKRGDFDEAIEHELRKACADIPMGELRGEINNLIAHIERTVALCRDVWRRIDARPGAAIGPTLLRWILLVSVWVRYAEKSKSAWEIFLEKLFRKTEGSSIVQGANPRDRVTLGLGTCDKLARVCWILESDFYVSSSRRRRHPVGRAPGYDDSHVEPFSKNGDGPTIPEPASRNRARGAKPIDE